MSRPRLSNLSQLLPFGCLGGSGDSIDKLFDEGGNAGQEHSIERDDDVLEETVAKDVSEVAAEKTKKKRKRKVVGDASGSTFPPKRLREDYHAAASNTRGKSLATICDLVSDGSSVPSGVTKPPTVVSVPPTPDDRPTYFVSGLNLWTFPPSLRYVVSSDDSHHSGSCSDVKSFSRSPAADAPVTTVAVTTTVTTDASAVPPPKARVVSKNLEIFRDSASAGGANADAADDSYVCRDLTDRLAPPALFLQLYAMDYDQLYTEFNVGAARQAAEAIRLRGQISAIEAADAAKGNELRDLKERNFVLEGENDVLFEKVKTLESVVALKETELASFAAQVTQLTYDLFGFQLSRDELSSKVVSLESERDSLVGQKSSLESAFELFRERMEAMQDEKATVLGNRVAKLDAQLLEMAAHLDEEFYPLNKGIQDGLKERVDHGKAGRDLSVIEAYDPSAEANYIDAVNALGAIDFSLLSC
ncbi:hypothetical protein Tco_1063337 [Tanacetum coccineum]